MESSLKRSSSEMSIILVCVKCMYVCEWTINYSNLVICNDMYVCCICDKWKSMMNGIRTLQKMLESGMTSVTIYVTSHDI